MPIRLIVGLGNPGPEYEQTRHNAGFWLVDNLANGIGRCKLAREARLNAMLGKSTIAGNEVWLLEPQTFMNRSGQSVGALARFYKIAPEDILVVHDELDLAPGVARLKKGGSSGGHNGLKDITAALGMQDIGGCGLVSGTRAPRIRNKRWPITCCMPAQGRAGVDR